MRRPVALLLLAGCTPVPRDAATIDTTAAAPATAEPAAPAPRHAGTVVWGCEDGARVRATLRGDSLDLATGDTDIALPATMSATGASFVTDSAVFRTEGNEATITLPGAAPRRCSAAAIVSPWDAAAHIGVGFRAAGQEPGWVFEVHEGARLRWVGAYGAERAEMSVAEASGNYDTMRRWRGTGSLGDVVVEARREPCRDAMSGEASTHAVRVTVGGRTLSGCGRVLAPLPWPPA